MVMSNTFNRRHHDDETFDDISIVAEPRFKTSGLSGDEWRVSYRMVLKRKGTVLFERSYNRLSAALAHLPWVMRVMFEEGPTFDGFRNDEFEAHLKNEAALCHQVGCGLPSTVFYRLKQIYAKEGDGPLPTNGLEYTVSFCQRHSTRGDCGREDADDNYELIEGKVDAPPSGDVRQSSTATPVDLLSIVDPDELRAAVTDTVSRVRDEDR